jgi:predicted ferric reductase
MNKTLGQAYVTAGVLRPGMRRALGAIVIILAAMAVCSAVMLPLSGQEHEAAETAGKMCAIAAAALVLLQFALSARLKFLDHLYGLNRLLNAHRLLGCAIVVLATLHPLLVFAPANEEIGPLRLALWPVLFGILLLCGLWAAACLSLWRVFLRLPFERWWLLHRAGVCAGVVLLSVHALNVEGDFEEGLPRTALLAALAAYGLLFAWVKAVKPWLLQRKPYTVAAVSRIGHNVHAVELAPAHGQIFPYLPGQFSFVSFRSGSLPPEEHHFTLSSTPTRPGSIIFTIQCSGDFTSRIGRLRPGVTAILDGPYGLFSQCAFPDPHGSEIIMIAGGIGITPMLSMLRYMADVEYRRTVKLIWSNKSGRDVFCGQELDAMRHKMDGLTVHHVLTGQPDYAGLKGRLDAAMLGRLLKNCSRSSRIFLCGPPAMMSSVAKNLQQLGFKAGRISTERFSL